MGSGSSRSSLDNHTLDKTRPANSHVSYDSYGNPQQHNEGASIISSIVKIGSDY